ncbi:MAG: aminopeptidase N, partial [Pseudomonadota bacterium]
MRTDTGQISHLADYRATPYEVPEIALTFALAPDATVVTATTTFRARGEDRPPLVLEGDGLALTELMLNGAPLDSSAYEATTHQFILHHPPEGSFTLTIGTKVSPQANSELMGLYRSNGVYCTQCEAEGFRRITYHYDRPDVLSVYTVKILADGATTPVLLSNGNLVEEGVEDGRAFALWHDPFPKPSYLFALVAGDLDVLKDSFRTMDGREVALAIYVETGKAPRAAYAMD